MQQLFKKRETEPFKEPVDYEGLGLSDYKSIVKRMMDLGTVRKNIKADAYEYLEDVLDDIQLIWDNCKLYNIEASFIHKVAVKLEKATDGLLKDQFGDIVELNKNSTCRFAGLPSRLSTNLQEELSNENILRRKDQLQ